MPTNPSFSVWEKGDRPLSAVSGTNRTHQRCSGESCHISNARALLAEEKGECQTALDYLNQSLVQSRLYYQKIRFKTRLNP
ncbi:MAG: hypothetical protein AB4426_15810 [Xenococcaceae cyanobacterium]